MEELSFDNPPLPMMDVRAWQRIPHGEARVIISALSGAAVVGVPLLLVGAPGTGKSTIVRSFASYYGRSLEGNFLFEMTMNPGTSPSVIAGGIDLPALVTKGSVEVTLSGSAADPEHRVVFIDELGRAGPPALAALMRYTENPGRLVIGASNFDFRQAQQLRNAQNGVDQFLAAISQRFALVRVPRSVPRFDPKGAVRDPMCVAIDLVGEAARVSTGQIADIRRSHVFQLDDLGIPTYDEIVAFGSLFCRMHEEKRVQIGNNLRERYNDLATLMGTNSARVMTRIVTAMTMLSLFEQWRMVDPDMFRASYRAMRWDEYIQACIRDRTWTHIDTISPLTAHIMAAIADCSYGETVAKDIWQCFHPSIRERVPADMQPKSPVRSGKRARAS